MIYVYLVSVPAEQYTSNPETLLQYPMSITFVWLRIGSYHNWRKVSNYHYFPSFRIKTVQEYFDVPAFKIMSKKGVWISNFVTISDGTTHLRHIVQLKCTIEYVLKNLKVFNKWWDIVILIQMIFISSNKFHCIFKFYCSN